MQFTTDASWSYDSRSRQLTVEISQLQVPPGQPLPRTIRVKSHKTGWVLYFHLVGRDVDADHDTTGWRYRSEYREAIGELNLLIIND